MSQDACESRPTIYDERANSVLSVFLKFLIKKEWMLQRVVGVLCHAGGAFLFTIGKRLCTMRKNKN